MDKNAPALHPELVKISTLNLDPKNARLHGQRNLDVIGYSLGKFEQVKPIVVSRRTRTVIAGNGTLTEALEMGATEIVVTWVDRVHDDGEVREMTDADEAELAVLDNRSAELAEWDPAQLGETVTAFPEIEWDSGGWEPTDFADMGIEWPEAEVDEDTTTVHEHERDLPGDEDEDEIPDVPAEPVTQAGEVIVLGPHTLHCRDCMEVMAELDDNSVDSIVTDPPYGLSPDGRARTWDDIEAMRAEGQSGPAGGFMGSAWDSGVPGITWARECLRVLKPGGHIVAFSATRTVHRLACAIEDAGFEIRDQIDWLTYQGFPKSLDVSKAIDEALGCERTDIYEDVERVMDNEVFGKGLGVGVIQRNPAHDLAKTWNGHGTALKPAVEPAVLARKPLDKIQPEEVADLLGQDLIWSRKAIDTDKKREKACERWGDVPDGAIEWRGRPLRPDVEGRIELRVDGDVVATREGSKYSAAAMQTVALNVLKWGTGALNIDACRHADGDPAWPGPDGGSSGTHCTNRDANGKCLGHSNAGRSTSGETFHGPDTDPMGRWPANVYHCPKPARREREAGCEDVDERHSTVKPCRMIRQLATLVTPPGGTLLEPFGGSGTILPAVADLDCRVILAEREPKYMDIVRARGEWSLDPERKAPTTRPAGKPRTKARDGDKRQARRRVQTLIQNGTLPAPADVLCVDCQAVPGREYDHHLGYGAEHHEDVEALCAGCHHAREAERAKAKAPDHSGALPLASLCPPMG